MTSSRSPHTLASSWPLIRKKVSTVSDFRGLKLRIVNLGGKVYARAGATTVLTPLADIYAALERGVIDAAEMVGPHVDMKAGLHNTARYYYYPGWHEPGTTNEFSLNKKSYDGLPVDLRRTLDHAAAAVSVYGLTDYHAKNAIALERLKTEFTAMIGKAIEAGQRMKLEVLPKSVPDAGELKRVFREVRRGDAVLVPEGSNPDFTVSIVEQSLALRTPA